MTYVEFFDKTASENISACLSRVPDRVIYIGNNAKLMKKHISDYQKVFEARGYNIEVIFRTVPSNNLDKIVELLSVIVEIYDDCCFDITGGDEMMILAMGIVYSKYPEKNIQVHKFNLKNNKICDCDKDGTTIYKEPPALSIDENIAIYGGCVAYGSIDEDKTYKWDLTPDFLNDINLMWEVCKGDVRFWNVQIGILEAAEIAGGRGEDELTTIVSRAALEQYLARFRAKYKFAKGIITYLLDHGLLTHFEDDGETLTVSYKNKQVKKCLTKAGQALEMKIYTAAAGLVNDEGELIYNDALNGVVIDWDGELHDEHIEEKYDTENEIDIMLMHDMVPVFISCKNGIVTSDELYKLNTVAERFGSKYSKKVLVATSIADLGEAGEYLRQRIIDMGITLVEGVQDMSDSELKKKLKNLWN